MRLPGQDSVRRDLDSPEYWTRGRGLFDVQNRRAAIALAVGILAASRTISAQTTTWTGAAGNDLWSNGGNWDSGVPMVGGTAIFDVNGGGDSILDFSLSLDRFRYAPAILPEHDFHLAGGATLTLTGFGIDNLSRIPGFGQPPSPPGVIRQQLFIESGSSIIFRNTATIGGSDPVSNLPVDLNATGGRIIFEDSSTASGPPANTFTGLRIFGGAAPGVAGGELIFRGNSSMGFTAGFVLRPGEVAGATGAVAVFEGNAIASSGTNSILSGTGLGGRLIFRDHAKGTVTFNNSGAETLDIGNEAITHGGTVAGAFGGLTDFSGNATGGTATLTVEGGSNGGEGGTIRFRGNATGGIPKVIFLPGAGTTPNGLLEISGTNFGIITIGSIEGNGLISLGNKQIEVGGNNLETEFSGAISGAGGGLRKFGTSTLTLSGSSSYTGGTSVNDGVLRVTHPGGLGLGTGPVFVRASPTSELQFTLTGSAGGLTITNDAGTATATGITSFRSSSTAATATINNSASPGNGLIGGQTLFYATATAANATINNFGAFFIGATVGAEATFYESSAAGAATIINGGGYVANAEGGQANFLQSSSAGTSNITNYFANVAGAFPGATVFRGTATAGGATITNLRSTVSGASGGVTEFFDSSTGGTARITLEGGFGNGALAAVARFFNASSADRAQIMVTGGQSGTGAAGLVEFSSSATAGDATVRNLRAPVVGGAGGQT